MHILISMCDLLGIGAGKSKEENDKQFQNIRNVLMNEFPTFKNFVEGRQQNNSCVRLIPISSYGMGFAEMRDGEMYRIPGGKLEPFQMEMPLACTFRDQFMYELQVARKKLEKVQALAIPTVQEKFSLEHFMKDLAGLVGRGGVGTLRRVLPKALGDISDSYLKATIENMKMAEERRRLRRKEEMEAERMRLLQEQQERLRLVNNEATAKESVLSSCDRIIHDLETNFPSSVL